MNGVPIGTIEEEAVLGGRVLPEAARCTPFGLVAGMDGQRDPVEGTPVARYLKELPGEGIMAGVGYSPELAYLLPEKRVLGIPPSPGDLDRQIEYYDIDYLVQGQHYRRAFDRGSHSYIRKHPEKYKLIKVVNVKYRNKVHFDGDIILIYSTGRSG